MSDLYHNLNTNREVPPRTQDGFRPHPLENKPTQDTGPSTDSLSQEPSLTKKQTDVPDYLVKTAKSKLLTLEVSLRQELEQHLFDNPDISWDTFIESALILCLKNQSQTHRATKLAAERLADRKRSAVYKRTQTMAKKFISG